MVSSLNPPFVTNRYPKFSFDKQPGVISFVVIGADIASAKQQSVAFARPMPAGQWNIDARLKARVSYEFAKVRNS